MTHSPKRPKLPTGITRFFFRLPIWLYRFHLGWLLGGRFVLINHIGRKSGQVRQVVVEVVRHDQVSDSYIVCSGFGQKAQWYQNLLATPDVTIQVGARKLAVHAEPLSSEAGGDEMVDYAQRNPTAARNLSKFMGFDLDGSEAGYRKAGQQLPFIALRPR
ncbi:MAG TPA: nitroreductase family deazaflavin-dependent oxidoreductase [Caldilineaceae bacterium]|nr:nitroreductase family deazaflavin-dependent oxidoreductase [Caldilineaceae bacterium]